MNKIPFSSLSSTCIVIECHRFYWVSYTAVLFLCTYRDWKYPYVYERADYDVSSSFPDLYGFIDATCRRSIAFLYHYKKSFLSSFWRHAIQIITYWAVLDWWAQLNPIASLPVKVCVKTIFFLCFPGDFSSRVSCKYAIRDNVNGYPFDWWVSTPPIRCFAPWRVSIHRDCPSIELYHTTPIYFW